MVDSNAVAGPSNGLHTFADLRHRSRIHFSDDQSSSSAEALQQVGHPTGHSTALHKFHLASGAVPESRPSGGDERKRVHSLGARANTSSPFGSTSTRHGTDPTRGGKAFIESLGFGHPPSVDVFGPGALSDEYDLCELYSVIELPSVPDDIYFS